MSTTTQRIFQVVVLGGMGLAGASRCGSRDGLLVGDAPHAGGAVDAGSDGSDGVGVFPAEGPSFVDSGSNIDSAARETGADGSGGSFPTEGPMEFYDAGQLGADSPFDSADLSDAMTGEASGDVGFPREAPK